MPITSRLPRTPSLLLASILALGLYWLVPSQETHENSVRTPKQTPAYVMTNFSGVILDEAGWVRYQIHGKMLLHDEDSQSHTIIKPRLRLFAPRNTQHDG
jgi:LPS export ABC transporter protein LptC